MDPNPTFKETSLRELISRYEVFFLDAYGVLVNAQGALPGAAEFLTALRAAGKEILLLSNDASRLPTTSSQRYAGFGISLAPEQILTSGQLLPDYFAQAGLQGKRCIVLGTADSRDYTAAAGGIVTEADDDHAEVIILADDDDYPFLETINAAITVLMRRLSRRQTTHLVMPNPDVLFPSGKDAFGICSGAIAAMFEAAARLRDPSGAVRAVPLGKPHRPMFEAALSRFAGRDRRQMVMVGDQLGTDILGANRVGLDSVLILTGLSQTNEIVASGAMPTYVLKSLAI